MSRVMVELFSGTGRMAKAFSNLGWETYTFDSNPDHNPDFCVDILDVTPAMIESLNPDVIWAGVDCSCFSMLSVRHYWNHDGSPSSKNFGVKLLNHTITLIEAIQPTFWAIENPRGMMRKQPQLKHWARYHIWQCQYGLDCAKPTDLFGYLPPSFYPKRCKMHPTNCHHLPAPRGSQTGTQNNNKSKVEKSAYPLELCRVIATQCNQSISKPNGWFE
jgi:hypothetical protein